MWDLQALFAIIAFFVCNAFATDITLGSPGCSRSLSETWTPGGPSAPYDIESEELSPSSRHSLLYLPQGYSSQKPAPLIVALHGKSQPPSEFEDHTQLSNPAVNNKYIVVYPQGIKLQWTGDPAAPLKSEVNDISFINELLHTLEQDFCIDKNRIYATGFSNGGGLTHLLACDRVASNRMAAFAASSGAYYTDSTLKEPLFSNCHPARTPVYMLEFHGDRDPVEHYDGITTPDGPSYSLPEWLEDWASRDGCSTDQRPRTKLLHDGNVERMTWNCAGYKDVLTHYYIHGFGHGWPTTYPLNNDGQRLGPTYFNATPIILDFFESHHLQENQHWEQQLRDEL